MFITMYLSTFLIINKNTDFIRSWKRFQLKKSSILENILPLYKKVALDFSRGVLKIAPPGTVRVNTMSICIVKPILSMHFNYSKKKEFGKHSSFQWRKISTNSPWDFEYVLGTMDDYWVDPDENFCPESTGTRCTAIIFVRKPLFF